MSTQRLSVAVLGSGKLADLMAQRIKARSDLALSCQVDSADKLTARASCVVYLPDNDALASGNALNQTCELLKAGRNVVTPVPAETLGKNELLAACKAGNSTFHGSGGFQSSLPVRFNRAFSTITRNISDIALVEELVVPASLELKVSKPDAVGGYYESGLHTLSEAIFLDRQPDTVVENKVSKVKPDSNPPRMGNQGNTVAKTVVRRTLGEHASYDSVWMQSPDGDTPLRYHLHTRSEDAVGHCTIRFHSGDSELHPAEHLTCKGLLDAIVPTQQQDAGILHHDLEINYVMADDRL